MIPAGALAHNNPTFDKTLVAEVPVQPAPGADGRYSAPFSLELPEKTIQLHYQIVSDERDAIRFALASEQEESAADLRHDGTSKPIKSGPVSVVEVSGASKPFTIRIVAEFIVRKTA